MASSLRAIGTAAYAVDLRHPRFIPTRESRPVRRKGLPEHLASTAHVLELCGAGIAAESVPRALGMLNLKTQGKYFERLENAVIGVIAESTNRLRRLRQLFDGR
jgi:hypothetical protein